MSPYIALTAIIIGLKAFNVIGWLLFWILIPLWLPGLLLLIATAVTIMVAMLLFVVALFD